MNPKCEQPAKIPILWSEYVLSLAGKCLCCTFQHGSLPLYGSGSACNLGIRILPLFLLDRFASGGECLDAIPRIKAGGIHHVLERRPVRQSSGVEKHPFALYKLRVEGRWRLERIGCKCLVIVSRGGR